MAKETLISTSGPLLDEKGNLVEKGYSYSLIKKYDRSKIKAPSYRIKEWDYYYLGDHEHGLALTIADNGYMDMAAVTIFDFKKKSYLQDSAMRGFPLGKLRLPSDSSSGDTHYVSKKLEMHFLHEGTKRHLTLNYPNFAKTHEDLRADVYLEETTPETMVILTPFKKNGHFYYNQKRNLLSASGYYKLGDKTFPFMEPSLGVLDWGRGVWTYVNTWYWASANDEVDGLKIGFNLGYGFGDTTSATENMLFVGKEAFKLDEVNFRISLNEKGNPDYLKDWKITSNDDSLNLIFHPLIERKGGGNALLIKSDQHQVFGTYEGTILVPGTGKTIEVKSLMGFAEKVYNRW